MAIDKSGAWWTGSDPADITEYLKEFAAGGYEVRDVRSLGVCAGCGSSAGYRLRVDDEQGVAERTCAGCELVTLMLDSAEFIDEAELEGVACPCGGEVFDVAVGFAFTAHSQVKWVSVGLRCKLDGVLGCYADWKIDYEPAGHLLDSV